MGATLPPKTPIGDPPRKPDWGLRPKSPIGGSVPKNPDWGSAPKKPRLVALPQTPFGKPRFFNLISVAIKAAMPAFSVAIKAAVPAFSIATKVRCQHFPSLPVCGASIFRRDEMGLSQSFLSATQFYRDHYCRRRTNPGEGLTWNDSCRFYVE